MDGGGLIMDFTKYVSLKCDTNYLSAGCNSLNSHGNTALFNAEQQQQQPQLS